MKNTLMMSKTHPQLTFASNKKLPYELENIIWGYYPVPWAAELIDFDFTIYISISNKSFSVFSRGVGHCRDIFAIRRSKDTSAEVTMIEYGCYRNR